MSTTIALAGKGGVGKTTTAALIIKYLIQAQSGAVMAIDADPSSNLNMALGLELDWTVGDIREGLLTEVKKSLTAGGAAMGVLPGGATKRDYLDYQIRSSVAEGDQVDLIAMGRGEGAGCYCAVNHNLREVIDSISSRYRYIIIDNEAGMEHLSRRTTRDVQHLIIVSDPTLRGLAAVQRIVELKNELDINIEKAHLVLNRISGPVSPVLLNKIQEIGIPLAAQIPADDTLNELELAGHPIVDLPDDSLLFQSIKTLMDSILDAE